MEYDFQTRKVVLVSFELKKKKTCTLMLVLIIQCTSYAPGVLKHYLS